MQRKLIFIYIIISLCISTTFLIKNVQAEEKIKDIEISTSPHKVFFDISNGKPGDTFTKVLKIQNNGSKDFNYLFSNHFLTGSKKIYKELVLTVSDNSNELYNGKLKDFEKLESRILKSKTNEDLKFRIYFPYDLGNEFQNLNCEFQFKFYVKGTLGGTLPVDGPKLPETGTNMFNIMLAGIVLVLTGSIYQFFQIRRKRIDRKV